MNLEFIKPQNLGSLLMKSSQSNFNLRSPSSYLVCSYLITTVQFAKWISILILLQHKRYLSPDKNLIRCTIVKFLFKCIFVKWKKTFFSRKGAITTIVRQTNKNLGKSYSKLYYAKVIHRRRACALLALKKQQL